MLHLSIKLNDSDDVINETSYDSLVSLSILRNLFIHNNFISRLQPYINKLRISESFYMQFIKF